MNNNEQAKEILRKHYLEHYRDKLKPPHLDEMVDAYLNASDLTPAVLAAMTEYAEAYAKQAVEALEEIKKLCADNYPAWAIAENAVATYKTKQS